MTATASTLDGEIKLQFTSSSSDGGTLTQNKPSLSAGDLYGFVSNVSSSNIINDYKSNFSYTGETIIAKNMSGGGITAGQLCTWFYNNTANQYGFNLADSLGSPRPDTNTGVLAICLGDTSGQTVSDGSIGVFLLKGFVSSNYININGATDGEPLYIQSSTTPGAAGDMTIAANWSGSTGNDVWRCVGYLFSVSSTNGGAKNIVRFDPSTDYIF
jgi:hypothetical protein